jgi:Pvc16 N-terminal domain
MIDFLDRTLKSLLESRLPVTVGFDVPDLHWRTHVSSTGGNFLNVYLVELRENRKLRSNEVVSRWAGPVLEREMAPARLDCHYVVSAWTPAGIAATMLVEATVDEQVLLYDAAKVLLDSVPLDVGLLYPAALVPPAPPPEMLEEPLPAVVAPPDGFGKLPDFWMRMDWVWKPVIELIVTVPVVAVARPAGPPVTTLTATYLQNGRPTSAEELLTIGGVVRTDGSRSVPDGATTANSPFITSATAAWTQGDVGRQVTGPNIPPSAFVLSVQSAVGATLNAKATATGAGLNLVIGGPVSVANAWVRVVELDRMVKTNLAGQFIFAPVSRGQYHLESGAAGHAIVSRLVDVPSLSGEYDLLLP